LNRCAQYLISMEYQSKLHAPSRTGHLLWYSMEIKYCAHLFNFSKHQHKLE